MTRQFVVRPECFGATVYDAESLSYFFINQAQLSQLANAFSIQVRGLPESVIADACQSPDLSGGKFADALVCGGEIIVRTTPEPLPPDTLAAPIRVYFELTTRCNAGCKYCLNDSGTARPGELSTEEVFQAIQKMAHDGVFEVRLTGGEPTLRRDFCDIAREVKRSGMSLSVIRHTKHIGRGEKRNSN